MPSVPELVDDLRGINQQLRRAQRRLGDDAGFGGRAAMMELGQAQVEFFAEDYPRAAIRLMQLVSRPGFRDQLAYPEALYFLGESLWAMGMRKAAVEHLRESLQPAKQPPGEFRRRLARYLVRAGEVAQVDEVRAFWRRYQATRADGPLSDEDRDVRYEYAKALFRGGALAEAEALFDAVDEADPYYLRARYFVGVLKLKRDDVRGAKAAFQAALEAYQRVHRPSLTLDWPDADQPAELDGPARDLLILDPIDADDDADEAAEEGAPVEPPARDAQEEHERRMGALIHLALARLAAATDDDRAAWHHYRRVPPGDPDFVMALSEATFVLFRREHYLWCARLIDQLLATRGDDVSAAQLALWKAQLLARGARFDEARASYVALDEAMQRRATELEAELEQARRLFPQAVLAWTAPEDANRARALEAELVQQEEALIEAREMAQALRDLLNSSDPLPPVRYGREVQGVMHQRMDAFDAGLQRAAEAAHAEPQTGAHGGAPAATDADIGRLRDSARRLRGRLTRFDRTLDAFDRTYRDRIRKVLQAEEPNVQALDRALAGERRSMQNLATAMRTTARTNLENFAAEALFGQVDIAYWRKEDVTRRIREAMEERADIEGEMNTEEPTGAPLPKPEPPATPAPPAQDEPTEDDEGPGDEDGPGDDEPPVARK